MFKRKRIAPLSTADKFLPPTEKFLTDKGMNERYAAAIAKQIIDDAITKYEAMSADQYVYWSIKQELSKLKTCFTQADKEE